MSFLPYDPDLGYSPESDDPMGLGNLAARQRGQTRLAENPADERVEPRCRRCGAGECGYCGTPVRSDPAHTTLCHECHEIGYGVSATEIDLVTGANAPIVPPCRRRDRRLAS